MKQLYRFQIALEQRSNNYNNSYTENNINKILS